MDGIDTNLIFDWIVSGYEKDFPCPNHTVSKTGNRIYIEGGEKVVVIQVMTGDNPVGPL